jgi:DNA-binding NarL/FixJ family response regulator/signal transduction histidine kinase
VASHLLEAVTGRRFLITRWPWRAIGYLATTPPIALAAGIPLGALALPWFAAAAGRPLGVTILLLVLGALLVGGLGPLIAVPLAAVERRRLRLVDARPLSSAHSAAGSVAERLRTRYGEAATWRELAYTLFLIIVVPPAYGVMLALLLIDVALIASPLVARPGQEPVALGLVRVATPSEALPYALAGLVALPAIPYLLALLSAGQATAARALLQRGLRDELVEVSRSRARIVDAFEAERRRIERDLHDGAQQRLLSLTLKLGLARVDLAPDSPAARNLAAAHEEAKLIMTELRELIRGIHPRVLTDRGLAAALTELADRSAVPVEVEAELPGRLPRHIEGVAYFVAAEALANIAKHSAAEAARIPRAARHGRPHHRGAGRRPRRRGSRARHRPRRARRPGRRGRWQHAAVQPARRSDPAIRGDPMSRPIRVVLAEDGVLLREGLVGLLGRFGFDVAATAADADGLLAAVAAHSPDLVVTDIRMPPGYGDEGLRAAVQLRRADPALAVVALSQYVELSYAAELLDSGSGERVGYLLKDRVADVQDFAASLREVVDGGTVVDPTVVRQLLRRRRDPLARLSPREREVLALIAEGHANAAIARRLYVTEVTVGKHVGNIFTKLDLPLSDTTHRRVLAVLTYLRNI